MGADEWFKEFCHVCKKVNWVHDDLRTNLNNPGFICQKCEDNRKDYERFMKDMICSDLK